MTTKQETNVTTLTQEKFASPFRYLDAKLAEFTRDREQAKAELERCGWVLRPNHEMTGVWRARRWVEAGTTLRLSAPSVAELVRLAREEFEPRRIAREEAEKAREKAKAEKEARRAARAAKT